MKTVRLLVKGIFLVAFLLFSLWGGLVLYFRGPGPGWCNFAFALLFFLTLPGLFWICRSFLRGSFLYLTACVVVLLWWNSLTPSSIKLWAPEVAKTSHGVVKDNLLTMHNIRNFQYTTMDDFMENWETRSYDLENLRGLDLFLSYWASNHIAHTILSWDFGDGQHLAISIETRKDKDQQYSAIKGFFREYELIYVAGDERDLIGVRTNFRKERVYVYRLKVPNERAKKLLLDYVQEMNRLVEQPRFYNALTRNCTTTIHLHTKALNPQSPYKADWRLIVSGYVDELLYSHGLISQVIPFEQLRKQNRIDKRMQIVGLKNYSSRLRERTIK